MNTNAENETLNVGATPTSTPPTQPSAGEPPSNPEPSRVEVATESPYDPDPSDEDLSPEEQYQVERELRQEQNRAEFAAHPHDPPPVPSEKVLALARALGLENTKWTRDKIRQMESLDHMSTIPIVVGVLLVTGLDSIEQCQKAYKVLGDLAENPDSSHVVKVAAAKALAETVKAHQAMSMHALSLAKETQRKKNGSQPKFLPPSLALQINCPPGTPPPAVQVASVTSGQEQEQSPADP